MRVFKPVTSKTDRFNDCSTWSGEFGKVSKLRATGNAVPDTILLQKPFAPAQLVTAVAQLLNASSPPLAAPTK
jgi:hypothetical protein